MPLLPRSPNPSPLDFCEDLQKISFTQRKSEINVIHKREHKCSVVFRIYLSSHTSYLVSKLSPPFLMTLYFWLHDCVPLKFINDLTALPEMRHARTHIHTSRSLPRAPKLIDFCNNVANMGYVVRLWIYVGKTAPKLFDFCYDIYFVEYEFKTTRPWEFYL